MAGTPITPAKRTFYFEDIQYRTAVSEGILLKFAEMAQYFSDRIYHPHKWTFNGNFRASENHRDGLRYIWRDTDIQGYYMSLENIGTSGSNVFNIDVYDENDALLGPLFGSGSNRCLINGIGGGRENVIVGQNLQDAVDIEENTSGLTYQVGVLNYTTLNAGWKLRARIEGNGVDALTMHFELRTQEQ